MVGVPPIVKVVAAPAKVMVVLKVFHRATVRLLLAVKMVGKFKLKVPNTAEAVALPILTLVVEPAPPAVARFTVLVVTFAVTLAE